MLPRAAIITSCRIRHPAVFIADTDGRIRFAHVNPDYKVRLEPKKILEEAQAAGR